MDALDFVDLEILNIEAEQDSTEITFKISKKFERMFETSIGLVKARIFVKADVLSKVSNSQISESRQAYIELKNSQILSAQTTTTILSPISDELYDTVSSEISEESLKLLQLDTLKIEVDSNE